jgi:ssDNA-binding Zn-finger/Zn-ribbon topoisomerase 1
MKNWFMSFWIPGLQLWIQPNKYFNALYDYNDKYNITQSKRGFNLRNIIPAKQVPIDKVYVEKVLDEVVPDVIIESGGRRLIVEICVTHAIDESKLQKIKSLNISTIEIDLSKQNAIVTKDELENIVLNLSPDKVWRFHSQDKQWIESLIKREQDWAKKFSDVSESLKLTEIKSNSSILNYFIWERFKICNCPIQMRIWNGETYAEYRDCITCLFLIGPNQTQGNAPSEIFCSGRKYIAEIEDFNLSQSERKMKYASYIDNRKSKANHGRCPKCDAHLIRRSSTKGDYPRCKFTTNAKICPHCGGSIVLRKNLSARIPDSIDYGGGLIKIKDYSEVKGYSEFLGCSNYPKCKFSALLKKRYSGN